jgi:hypothetical protein
MKTFNDLVFVDETMYDNKVWSRSYMMFDNGYGVSVVKSPTSYGGQSGLYELAVLDDNGFITYGTHITDDVLGFLTPDDVTRHMIEIQELPIKEIEKQTIKRTNKMKDLDLKVARGIAAGTAVLAGLGVIGMMIFSDYAMERGLNEYNLLGSLFIFFMGTLYTLAVDAEISRRSTESEAMQKVHQTTLNQCIWMMVALLLLSIPCLFL